MFGRQTARREIFRRRLLSLFLFCAAALIGSNFVRITLQDDQLSRELAAVRSEIAMLESERGAWEAQIALRQTEAYIEQKARELGYVRRGEALVIVNDAATASPVATLRRDDSLGARLSRWLALFFQR
jgi:cell division protein FtsB